MGEDEIYTVVSCLLKFKSWVSGRKVTVFTDHESLKSWYKGNLCAMAGPLGRRGRSPEFLSRYNIVVVYKPGKDNDVAEGMSRWAHPAGLADDTNLHGLDDDSKGYEDWARNHALIDRLSISPKGSECGPPCCHTAKCHGHRSGYSNLRATSHYSCFHYECASPETANPDRRGGQRAADALLLSKYRAKVTPEPLSAD